MGDWREKFRKLIREAAQDCVDRPIKVVPRRSSGPRIVPQDWHREEGQALLPKNLPVCQGCGGFIIGDAWPGPSCATCYAPPKAEMPELPPAA